MASCTCGPRRTERGLFLPPSAVSSWSRRRRPIDTLSVGALGFGGRLPREPGFIPPGSGAFVHYTPGFFSVRAMARRATLFIDGNNWYHGLKGLGSVDLGRLDYRRLSLKLVGPRQWIGTRYYIGRVPQSGDVTLYTCSEAQARSVHFRGPRSGAGFRVSGCSCVTYFGHPRSASRAGIVHIGKCLCRHSG